jgi:hypothetical protein
VASFDGEVFDIGTEGFGDPQPGQCQQRDQGVVTAAGQPGGDQQGADLVAIQTNRPGLVVQLGTPHMRGWRHVDEAFLFGVPVEGHDRRQATRDGGAGSARLLEPSGVQLDVGSGDAEQFEMLLSTPAAPLTQIQAVRLAGAARIAGQEPGDRDPDWIDQNVAGDKLDSGRGGPG